MSKASGSIDLKSLKVAGEGASKYITEIDGDGIKVHAENNVNTNYSLINAEGMEIFQGDTVANSISVAKFGAVARIGTEEDANIAINSNSISGVGASGKEFFVFEDSLVRLSTSKIHYVRDYTPLNTFPFSNGGYPAASATLPETPSSGTNVNMLVTIKNGNQVTKRAEMFWQVGTAATKSVNLATSTNQYGTLYATYNGSSGFSDIKLSQHYIADTTTTIRVAITYKIVDYAPAYKIGSGHTASGAYAYAEGYGNTASGNYSHAEGYTTTASLSYAHAEGNETTASGNQSHAEGHNTTASEVSSHSEGSNTVASGRFSHAQNRGTNAVADAQTTIGTWNEIDDITSTTHGSDDTDFGHYALVIGNGTADNARSNAMTVNWNGNVNASGQYENLYKITTVQKVISGGINANNYVAAANITMTAEPGYNAVGIVGHASNYFRVQPTTNYVVNNTTLFAGFANWSATNVTADVTVTFYVLWLKATAAS